MRHDSICRRIKDYYFRFRSESVEITIKCLIPVQGEVFGRFLCHYVAAFHLKRGKYLAV